MRILLLSFSLIVFAISAQAGELIDEPRLDRLDIVLKQNITGAGGTIETKNNGILKLDWQKLDPYVREHKEIIQENISRAITRETAGYAWLSFDPHTKTLSGRGIWFAYVDTIISYHDSGDRIKVAPRLCPSFFYLDKNAKDFPELYEKIKQAKGKKVVMAAQPAGFIYDLIIVDSDAN